MKEMLHGNCFEKRCSCSPWRVARYCQMTLSAEEFFNGRAVRLVAPDYPPIARSSHVSGAVVVYVTIDEKGTVDSAEAVSGSPLLKSAAIDAARRSKFTPTLLCGQPVKVNGVIIFNFVGR